MNVLVATLEFEPHRRSFVLELANRLGTITDKNQRPLKVYVDRLVFRENVQSLLSHIDRGNIRSFHVRVFGA